MANTKPVMVEIDLEKLGAKDKAAAEKLLGTFIKQRNTGKARDKAIQKAVKALKTKYETEFKAMVKVEMTKAGLS